MLKTRLWCPLEMNRQEFYFLYYVRNETVLLGSWWCYPHLFSSDVSLTFLYLSEWTYAKEEGCFQLCVGLFGFVLWLFGLVFLPSVLSLGGIEVHLS